MLEFLGFKVDAKSSLLTNRETRSNKRDDVYVEDFGVQPLSIDIFRKVTERRPDLHGEEAVAFTIRKAHKAVAHLTSDLTPLELGKLQQTCWITNTLLNGYFFRELQLPEIALIDAIEALRDEG